MRKSEGGAGCPSALLYFLNKTKRAGNSLRCAVLSYGGQAARFTL